MQQPDATNALLAAARSGWADKVFELLGRGADASTVDNYGRPALHVAAYHGHAGVVEVLLLHGAAVKALSARGHDARHAARAAGHTAIVQLLDAALAAEMLDLLDQCAHVTAAGNHAAWSELFTAVYHGREGAVKALPVLQRGAKPAAAENHGWSALHAAARHGHAAIVQDLLQHGADAAATNKNGRPALHVTAYHGHAGVVEVLLLHGAAVKALSARGHDARHAARAAGHTAIVQLLDAAATAEANAKHSVACTPLAAEVAPPVDADPPYVPEKPLRELVLALTLDAVPRLQQIVNEADAVATARRAKVGPAALCQDAALAIALYTHDLGDMAEGPDGSGNFYHAVNEALRRRDACLLCALRPFLHWLNNAWAALPVETGTYYRGVPASAVKAIDKEYQPGRQVYWSGITSVSSDVNVARRFASKEGRGGVVMEVTVVDGRCVAPYSCVRRENEVLLDPNTMLAVTAGLGAIPAGEHHHTLQPLKREKAFRF